MSRITTESKLSFKPIDLDKKLAEAIRFREDSYVCSFGNADKFRANDYISWLKERISADPEFAMHVWRDGRLIGQMEIGQFKSDPSAGYINLYYLVPEMRGSGYSAGLDEFALERFRARGYKRAFLSVSPTNGRALSYYRRMGWHDLGPRPEAPEVHLMEKLIP